MDIEMKRKFRKQAKKHRSTTKPSSSLFHIPEPIHRVTSVSKGISFRKLPNPSFEEIRNTCTFFLRKAGGKVNPKSKTHRYLYEMSNEIIAISRHLEKFYDEKFRRQRKLIARYKTITKEWQDVFGSDFTDEEFTIGERFATPKTLFEELVRTKRNNTKFQHQLNICKERERRANRRYQTLITTHHDSSRKAMEKNYLCLNEKLEKIMAQHKQEFLETLKEKNEFIQKLTNEVSKMEEDQEGIVQENEHLKNELEGKELQIIKQKKVILRQQQREILRRGVRRIHETKSSDGEISSIGPGERNDDETTSLSMRDFVLPDESSKKESEEEEEGEEEKEDDVRDLNEEEIEMLNKEDVVKIINAYRQKIDVLHHENENYLSLLHRLQRAKYMDEFFTIKMRIREMFGGDRFEDVGDDKEVVDDVHMKVLRTPVKSSSQKKKKIRQKKKRKKKKSSVVEFEKKKKWNGLMETLERNTLDASYILERMKTEKGD